MMLRPKSENVSPPVVSDSLQHYGLQPTRSSVHGILQARILAWVAIPFSRGSSWPRYRTQVSCISDRLFPIWVTSELGEALISILRFCNYLLYSVRGGEERGFMTDILWESEPLMLNLPILKKKLFFWLHHAACKILVINQGSNPCPFIGSTES